MFEDFELIYLNIRILRFLSLLYEANWRRYVCMPVITFFVFTQFNYMFRTDEGLTALISNAYTFILWVSTVLRAYFLLYKRANYEHLLANMERYQQELKDCKEFYIRDILEKTNQRGKTMSRGNIFLGMMTSIGFACYPLMAKGRVLPFGTMIPLIDQYKSPAYEVMFVYQMLITPVGCCMYIPFTSLVVGFIMFGIVMCKSLQFQLRSLKRQEYNNCEVRRKIVECIIYQNRIMDFITTVNSLTTYIFLFEFIAFGTLICALLFLLIIANSSGQAIIVGVYITMILAQIFALYWYANELREQSMAVADAAYETDWFTFDISTQKDILLVISRAQNTATIMVGYIYPMTLQLFQALLNASYTYFTFLRRVYG